MKAKGKTRHKEELERIGKNVKYYREEQGLSQEELAHVAECTPQYLSGVENGRENPTVNVLAGIADALNMDINDLTKKGINKK